MIKGVRYIWGSVYMEQYLLYMGQYVHGEMFTCPHPSHNICIGNTKSLRLYRDGVIWTYQTTTQHVHTQHVHTQHVHTQHVHTQHVHTQHVHTCSSLGSKYSLLCKGNNILLLKPKKFRYCLPDLGLLGTNYKTKSCLNYM